MAPQDLLKQFPSAAWGAPEDAQAFVTEAGAPPPAELAKLLEILAAKGPHDPNVLHNRTIVFTQIAERAPSEEMFLPYVRALKTAEGAAQSAIAGLIPKNNSVPGH